MNDLPDRAARRKRVGVSRPLEIEVRCVNHRDRPGAVCLRRSGHVSDGHPVSGDKACRRSDRDPGQPATVVGRPGHVQVVIGQREGRRIDSVDEVSLAIRQATHGRVAVACTVNHFLPIQQIVIAREDDLVVCDVQGRRIERRGRRQRIHPCAAARSRNYNACSTQGRSQLDCVRVTTHQFDVINLAVD